VSSSLSTPAAVIQIFTLLFTNTWFSLWQEKWRQQRLQMVRPKSRTGGKSKKWVSQEATRFYQRIFSLRVSLWYLIFQRLNFDHSLAAVVSDVRAGGADRLGRRARKLSSRILSTQTSAYNQARQRLPLELLQAALVHLRGKLLLLVGLAPQSKKKPQPLDRIRQILDGSTLAILKTKALASDYAVARNGHGTSDWCLMRILVGFCARSGAVLSAIEGALKSSEQAMTWTLIEQAAKFTIWMGDSNFGVWSVVAQALRYKQDALVRMTRARAGKLSGGRPLKSGEDRRVQWLPSRHDQAAPGTERKAIEGRLLYVRIRRNGKWIDLWLFTTLDAKDFPLKLLVQWYGQRWQAELYFRSVKTEMELAELQVCTPAMARKEFYAALLAYSLVRAVMWSAGTRLEGGIKTISFSQSRRVLSKWLAHRGRKTINLKVWARTLILELSLQTLPKRKKKRPSEVRRIRRRREKFPPLKGTRAAARARYGGGKSS
jgi:hypothetical protein